MGLAEKTVKNYTSHLLAKLGLERRTQAAILATELRDRRGADRSSPAGRSGRTRPADLGARDRGHGCQPPAPPLGAVGQVGQAAAHGDRRQPAAVVGDHASTSSVTSTVTVSRWRRRAGPRS